MRDQPMLRIGSSVIRPLRHVEPIELPNESAFMCG